MNEGPEPRSGRIIVGLDGSAESLDALRQGHFGGDVPDRFDTQREARP
jgi:hypothetical protein